MKQTFTKNNTTNTNSSGGAVLRQGTLLRVPAFVVLFALCCISCRNVIEAPEETAEIAESGGGTEAAGKLYTLSGAERCRLRLRLIPGVWLLVIQGGYRKWCLRRC